MLALAGFVIVLVYLIYKYCAFKKQCIDVDKLPGPKPAFLAGNALDLGVNPIDLLKNINLLAEKYGPIMRFWIGPFNPVIMISGVDEIEYFLGSTIHIDKSPSYDLLQSWLGKGLLLSKGDKWRLRRKLLTPTFHFKILEQFVPIFNSCGNILIQKLSEMEKKGIEFDVSLMLKSYALDIICETSMGIQINAQEKESCEYSNAIAGYLEMHLKRTYSLIKRNQTLYKLTATYRKQRIHEIKLKQFVSDVIKQKRLERAMKIKNPQSIDDFGRKQKTAFMDLLLDLSDDNQLTDQDIREEVDNFLFAAHHTISTVLSMALFKLAKHPNIQKKILEEIENVYGNENQFDVSFHDFQKLKYIECVLKETMRLYTPVPIIERKLKEDIVYKDLKLPSFTTICINDYMLHRDPKNFPQPEKFIPDRFTLENSRNRHPYAFVPFSAGPRNCIGQKYAMMVMKSSLAKIIVKFEIIPCPNFEIILGNGGLLQSENGIFIQLKRRC